MIYSLKFVYHDNKDLVINIAADKLQAFFGALNGKQMYFDELNNMGFWTDLEKIRYVQAFMVSQPEGGLDAAQAPQGDSSLPTENAGNPIVEAIA